MSQGLATKTKIFYGLGSIAYGVKDGAFRSFILLFYNQVVGMPAPTVSAAILIALVADSFLDPIIGQFSDSLKTRWGRRHPLMYFSALPSALAFLFLWLPPEGASEGELFVYLVLMAVLARTFITIYEIPSSALAPELTPSYDERTSIMGYRYFFGIAGGVFLAFVTLAIFLRPTEVYPVGQLNPNGWWYYAILSSIIIFFSILISAYGTHHMIPSLMKNIKPGHGSLKDTVRGMVHSFSNSSFLALMGFGVIKFTATGIVAALYLYFGTYFWELSSRQLSLLVFDNLVGAIVALVLAPKLSRRMGKRNAAALLLVLTVCLGFLPFLLRFGGIFPENGTASLLPTLFFIQCIYSICAVSSLILVSSMLADVVEDSAIKTGRRTEGLFFAANSLIQKSVSGIGIFVAGFLLSVVEFPVGAKPGEVPAETVTNLILVYMPTLVLFYGGGLLCLMRYKIDRQKHDQNVQMLSEAEKV